MLSLAGPSEAGYVTGVRIPAPDARRRDSFWGAKSPFGLKMVVDKPCTLLVCFHEVAALAGSDSVEKSGFLSRRSSNEVSKLELPKWVEEMGLERTSTTVRPKDGT